MVVLLDWSISWSIGYVGAAVNMKPWHKFLLLVLASAVIHELGHIIVGGGITNFRYAPELDILSTQVSVLNWNIYSAVAGILFTLPLLKISPYPKLLFLFFLVQARWDFLYILQELNPYSFDFGWTVVMG